jgi:NitT/TauT family transport system ATP-binding protein
MSALLDVSGVTLRYKTPSVLVTATDRVSFQVNRSDRFVLLGPSGCGKSTLLKAVGGYLTPSEGKIRIKGHEVTEPGADRMMVFQEFDQLLPWKTVLENVMFPLLVARKMSRKEAEDRASAYIEKVSLTRAINSYPHTLSGGMKQRVAIARGMALGGHQVHGSLRHALDCRGHQDRQPHPSPVAPSRTCESRGERCGSRVADGRQRRPA